jgi:hypothetical protein
LYASAFTALPEMPAELPTELPAAGLGSGLARSGWSLARAWRAAAKLKA